MTKFIVRRIGYSLVTIIMATIIVFTLSRMTGDPRYLYLSEYSHISADVWDAWGEKMGLDKPLPVQYLYWLGNSLKGDWGESIVNGANVRDMVIERIPLTLQMTAGGFGFALLFGIPLGMLSAVKKGTILDYFGRGFAILGQSVPSFWLAIVFIIVFSVKLGWLPTAGPGGFSHWIMPSVCLGWLASAGLLRLTRSALLDVLDSEFIKFARAKGASSTTIIWKHGFRNALIPPLTYSGLMLAGFANGSVVTETIFAWPGIGVLVINALYQNDYPVLLATALVFAVIYVLFAFIVDLLYAAIDPRIRYS